MELGACHECASGSNLAFHVDFCSQIHRVRIFCGAQDWSVQANLGTESGESGSATTTVAPASVRADIVGLHLPYLRAGGFNMFYSLNSLCHVLGSVRSCLPPAPACMRRSICKHCRRR